MHLLLCADSILTGHSHLLAIACFTDVGSGSGYLISVFSHLVSPNGYVLGLEHIPDLVEQSRQSLLADPVTKGRLEKGEIEVKEGDGRVSQGHEGIWDAIHVGAAAREVPNELLRGLKSPGRMFIPVRLPSMFTTSISRFTRFSLTPLDSTHPPSIPKRSERSCKKSIKWTKTKTETSRRNR